MNPKRTYLDWNASAPLRPEARSAMVAALDAVGNPSSIHAEGRLARRVIEDARDKVATLVGASPNEVVFTSGATEANNWVHRRGWSTIFYAPVEHASVLATIAASASQPIEIPVLRSGAIDLSAFESALAGLSVAARSDRGTTLLTLQAANNETGVLQPLADAVALAKSYGLRIACDAVQVAGKIPFDLEASEVDYLTLSAHKIGGPKGVGAVVIRDGASLPAMLIGGGQEQRLRAGTENVAAIAGFGAAAEAAANGFADAHRIASIRDRLEAHVLEAVPGSTIIGSDAERLPNTCCVSIPARSAETLVAALDIAGIAVSAGSACSSGKVAQSHVLTAMGLAPAVVRGAIRISIGATTTEADVAALVAALKVITGRTARAA